LVRIIKLVYNKNILKNVYVYWNDYKKKKKKIIKLKGFSIVN